MSRTAIVLLAVVVASAPATAIPARPELPDSPVMNRPADEMARMQVSIEARFVSVSQTDLDELMFEGTGSLNSEFVAFSIDGAGSVTETGSVTHVDAPPTGWGDMFWCGFYLWGAWDQKVRAYNRDGTYAGTYFWGPLDAAQSIEYSGSWWYASSPGNYLWRGQWDWTPGGTPGWADITTHTLPDVAGIAYDSGVGKLWVAMASNHVRMYGVDGGPVLADLPLITDLGNVRACCMAETRAYGPALLVLHSSQRSGDWIVFYDVSDTPVETTSWASIKALYR